MTTLMEDLRTRWRPSDEAIAAAADAYTDPTVEAVYSGHVLLGKDFGVWDADVTLDHSTKVFTGTDRYDSARAAKEAALIDAAVLAGERPATLGWTWHHPDGTWAVFEEILDVPTVLKIAKDEGRL
jgi:3-hydroxyisobutyrate dehydrogenase-like beta-hydroxyacid dehydrogenase